MKKLILLLLIICIPLCASAREEYPVLPDNLAKVCVARFGFDETGSRVLYEKVPITEDFSAWMIGWFWDDYKIVIGITDECDVIYFNRASLSVDSSFLSGDTISLEKASENASEFLTTALGAHKLRLTSSTGYTYNFSEFHNGIRVVGHDATVVVDKASGEVFYYKGFGKYNAEYKILERMVSKSSAFDAFFENSGLELVYSTNLDPVTRTKTNRPMYIFNNTTPVSVDAETGTIHPVLMYDYNYYYNDSYYDPKFSKDNSIDADEGIFEAEYISSSDFGVQKLKNIFYALRIGYGFRTVSGKMNFANGKSVPALQIDIAPDAYKTRIAEFSNLYDRNDTNIIALNPTTKEYIFARAYVDAVTGEILKFTSIPNENFVYCKPHNYVYSKNPRRITEFIVRATPKSEELRLFSQVSVNKHTEIYTYARYVNGARVIGEGVIIEFNHYANDITGFVSNMSLDGFVTLEGIKAASQMKEIIKSEIPFGLCYTDDGKGVKKVVFDFSEKSAAFDPVSGTPISAAGQTLPAQMIICSIGSGSYNVNGNSVTANPPLALNNKVYMPLRFVSEILGFDISYKDGTATLVRGDDIISVSHETNISKTGGKTVILPEIPIVSDNSMYISSNSIRSIFGLHILWETESNKIFIIN